MQAEFDAEREYLQTLCLLSPEMQQRHLDRQSISFMYQVGGGEGGREGELEGRVRWEEEGEAPGSLVRQLRVTVVCVCGGGGGYREGNGVSMPRVLSSNPPHNIA